MFKRRFLLKTFQRSLRPCSMNINNGVFFFNNLITIEMCLMRAMFHKINNKYNYVTIIRLRVQCDKYIIIVGTYLMNHHIYRN